MREVKWSNIEIVLPVGTEAGILLDAGETLRLTMRRKGECWPYGRVPTVGLNCIVKECTMYQIENVEKETTMREIKTHQVNGVNDKIRLLADENLGPGGAPHEYQMVLNPDTLAEHVKKVHFQNGPLAEGSANGYTHEVFLAMIADRLEHFQQGPYACAENQQALDYVMCAMAVLHRRTKARLERGVEGTSAI